MQYEFLSGSVSKAELKLWDRLSQGDLSVVEKIYELNAQTYFQFILDKVKSREKSLFILLISFYKMLEKQGELSGIELSKFLFDTIVNTTQRINYTMFNVWQESNKNVFDN